jgi:hypothetical protein
MAQDARKTCPDWVDEFIEDVGIAFSDGEVPTAYDIWEPEDPKRGEDIENPWVVHYYPALAEVVGGASDGARVHSGLMVDLISLQECFDDVEEFEFCSGPRLSDDRYSGAVVELRGWYQDHPVLLQVFDKPPRDARVDTYVDLRKVQLVAER